MTENKIHTTNTSLFCIILATVFLWIGIEGYTYNILGIVLEQSIDFVAVIIGLILIGIFIYNVTRNR